MEASSLCNDKALVKPWKWQEDNCKGNSKYGCRNRIETEHSAIQRESLAVCGKLCQCMTRCYWEARGLPLAHISKLSPTVQCLPAGGWSTIALSQALGAVRQQECQRGCRQVEVRAPCPFQLVLYWFGYFFSPQELTHLLQLWKEAREFITTDCLLMLGALRYAFPELCD